MSKLVIDLLVMAIVLFSGCGLGYLVPLIALNHDTYMPQRLTMSTVACTSDSMGLTLNCDDIMYTADVDASTLLLPGRIYTFRSPYTENETVVHRLVACLDDGCTRLIFKGDNNLIADPVINRSDVLKHVVRVEYRQ